MHPHKRTADAPPTRVLGVLGGIASGKSKVAELLAGPEGVVIDADRIAREVLELAETRAALRDAFGPQIFTADGALDRTALAARVFGDARARETLEAFTHPPVRARIRALLDEARARGVPRIVLDVPLLLENDAAHGLARECQELVFVDSDPAARDARAVAQRGWKPGEVARREALQIPLADKRARAHARIENRAGLPELEAAVARYLARTAPPAHP